ncbi:MAG: trypsin-like peptidase domain-containing protein [Rubrivivax sp.]|nr:trypsin-like peptidase domain-containing protein [Rubrivivax sp.]
MWRRHWLVFSQAVTVALAVLFVVGTLKPQWLPAGPGRSPVAALPAPSLVVAAVAPAVSAASAAPVVTSLAQAARRAAPAVVSIMASKTGRTANPHADDPRFRFFFEGQGNAPPTQTGLGSGVIVSREGYLLTNNHVVEGATEISVQLADGRQVQAQLIGTDPETDLALLKVDLDGLPVIALGNVPALQVGDAVLAIGNPFNVGQTVTSGIVSALGRNRLGLSTFENFIQTDAAINPGNSGGALVDAQGNLIGINTAIFSRSGGSLGIGFAIPVDTASQVMGSLLRDGRVRRGWIGIEPRDLTPELAESLGLPVQQGVLIAGVLGGGPAARAGLRPGDVVLRIGDKAVLNTTQLLATVAALQPESEAKIGLQRGDKAIDLKLTVALRPSTVARPR